LLLGLVGIDVNTGAPRMTLDIPELGDGIGFVPIAIGMFGVAELAVHARPAAGPHPARRQDPPASGRAARNPRLRSGHAPRDRLSAQCSECCRAAAPPLSSFAAYALEKKSRAIRSASDRCDRRVAGAEAANNAGAQASFIPLLTLGIPATPSWPDGRGHDDTGHPAGPEVMTLSRGCSGA
jgi:putative tricarboxylic transport membrane protein